ncbi:MAG: flagellar filament capping protein FliD [Solirubrobacteraceae bacterium]
MSLGGLSGLASGVDTSSLVEQLINLERQANQRLGRRKSAVQARQTGLKDVAAKLAALKTAAQDLSSATTWATKQTVESADPTRVTATLIGGAGIGGSTISVDRLASSAQRGYAWVPNAAAGTLVLTNTADPSVSATIQVNANAGAADVAAAINGSGGSPVSAAVITEASGAQRLVLSARTTGQGSAFTADVSGLGAGQMAEDAAYLRTGATLDAAYRLNGSGTVLNSQTNIIENAIAGVRLTLKGVSSGFTSVTVGAPAIDQEAVKTKVKAFVDAYNAVVTSTRSKLAERSVAGAATTTDAQKGQLFGDTGLLSMLSSLRIRMGERMAGLTGLDELADIGIAVPRATGTASQDAKDGKLAIDDKKLAGALAADPGKVRDLFSAFGAGLESFIKTQTGSTGVLDARAKNDDAEIGRISDQVTRAEERLTMKEKRLKAQFAAMESALLNAQSQSAWLSGQLATLG